MKAIGHRIHIKKLPIAENTEGGLVIAHDNRASSELAQQYGIVTDIGPDAWKGYRFVDHNGKEVNGSPWVEIGDLVCMDRYMERNVDDLETGERVVVYNDIDVLCIVRKRGTFDENSLPEIVITSKGVKFKEDVTNG